MKKSSIVISDYSSVGLDSIVLNIPTIIFESEEFKNKRYDHISNDALEATICVDTQDGLMKAIERYISEPEYLEKERIKHSNILCNHQSNSSVVLVDTLEKMLSE